jgi:hypothetical protein
MSIIAESELIINARGAVYHVKLQTRRNRRYHHYCGRSGPRNKKSANILIKLNIRAATGSLWFILACLEIKG